jgi:hypothetical protein
MNQIAALDDRLERGRCDPPDLLADFFNRIGQKQTSRAVQRMSALPPKADIGAAQINVRFVPKADMCSANRNVLFTLKSGLKSELRGRLFLWAR